MIQKPFIRPYSNTRVSYGKLLTEKDKELKKELVVPGITIPIDGFSEAVRIFLSGSFKTEAGLLKFSADANEKGDVVGKKKSDPNALSTLQKIYLEDVVENKSKLPSNYKYFGNGNVEGILKQLLTHNPFYTSTLQSKADGFSISSYAYNESPTRYSKLLTSYNQTVPRVNVKLDANLGVSSYQVFDAKGNDITSKYTRDEAIKFLLFTQTYYAEVVHASIHIYDFINVLGLVDGTEGAGLSVYGWGQSYLKNVPLKYFEVEKLLFSQNGALVGGGFQGDRTQVLQYVVDELLKPWLHLSTAQGFIDEFIFAYIPTAKRGGLLKSYLEQAALIPDFTKDLTAAIKKQAGSKYNGINEKLEEYYRGIGNDISNIADIGAWIQVMTAINIVHGSTFSFSRYIATPQFLPYLDSTNTGTYTATDANIAVTVLATTYGLSAERYVYTSELLYAINPLHAVLKTYNDRSNAIKTNHFNTISKDPNFADYGWIWTDFGPDLIDNKQLTLTTYV